MAANRTREVGAATGTVGRVRGKTKAKQGAKTESSESEPGLRVLSLVPGSVISLAVSVRDSFPREGTPRPPHRCFRATIMMAQVAVTA